MCDLIRAHREIGSGFFAPSTWRSLWGRSSQAAHALCTPRGRLGRALDRISSANAGAPGVDGTTFEQIDATGIPSLEILLVCAAQKAIKLSLWTIAFRIIRQGAAVGMHEMLMEA